MFLEERDQLFCLRYMTEFKKGEIKLGDLFAEIYPERREEVKSKDVPRELRSMAEKMLKQEAFKLEIAKYNDIESVDLQNEEATKDFVKKQLLNMYRVASSQVPISDRNGRKIGVGFMNSTVATKSLDLLGRSAGLFKDVVQIEEDEWTIGVDD